MIIIVRRYWSYSTFHMYLINGADIKMQVSSVWEKSGDTVIYHVNSVFLVCFWLSLKTFPMCLWINEWIAEQGGKTIKITKLKRVGLFIPYVCMCDSAVTWATMPASTERWGPTCLLNRMWKHPNKQGLVLWREPQRVLKPTGTNRNWWRPTTMSSAHQLDLTFSPTWETR